MVDEHHRKKIKKTKKILKFFIVIGIIGVVFFMYNRYCRQILLEDIEYDVKYQQAELQRLRKGLPKNIELLDLKNGEIVDLPFKPIYSNLKDPFLKKLREQEKLDSVIDYKDEELDQFVTLCHWVSQRWSNKTVTKWFPFNSLEILKGVDEGYGGFCAHYAIVFLQSALSLGYQARYLDIFDHFLVEIWSNQYNKWIAIDPFNDCYYEWNGIPMSGLKIHNKNLENKEHEIKVIGSKRGKEFLDLYKHLAVVIRNNNFIDTMPWDYTLENYMGYLEYTRSKYYLSWRDNEYKEEFFMSGGRKEMAFSMFTSDPHVFNWKINQIKVLAIKSLDENTLQLEYMHNSPTWAYTRVRDGDEVYQSTDPSKILWQIEKGENTLVLRTVNGSGIRGPRFYLTVLKK